MSFQTPHCTGASSKLCSHHLTQCNMEVVVIIVLGLLFVLLLKGIGKGRLERMLQHLSGPLNHQSGGSFGEKRLNILRGWDVLHGPLYKSWTDQGAVVHLSAPYLAESVLTNDTHTVKLSAPWQSNHVTTWQRRREILAPALHPSLHRDIIEQACRELLVTLDQVEGCEVDVEPLVSACVFTVLWKVATGAKPDKETQKSYTTARHRLEEISEDVEKVNWLPDFIFSRTSKGKEYRKQLKVLEGLTKGVGKEGKEGAAADVIMKKREDWEDGEIVWEVERLIAQGHEPTSKAICWTLYLLGSHPEIQNQVFQELKQGALDKESTTGQLEGNSLLERVILESFRLFPAVPVIRRRLEKDLEIGNSLIPHETNIHVHLFSLHMDPCFTHPHKFNPNRWLLKQSRHPCAYMPFSRGPRNCLGKQLAIVMMQTVLSSILLHYRVKAVQRYEELLLSVGHTLDSHVGVHIEIIKRI